jgi:molecular chaperone GrpE (heat shock protein)
MWGWLTRLLGETEPDSPQDESRVLGLEREMQGLRLALEEKDQIIENLKSATDRQRQEEGDRVTGAVQVQMVRLMVNIANPLSQILTQAHLLEVEEKPIQAKDVLSVGKRLIRMLEEEGMSIEGSVGEVHPFDANFHEPLNADVSLTSGQSVKVKFAGIGYNNNTIRKAGVEKE